MADATEGIILDPACWIPELHPLLSIGQASAAHKGRYS